MTLIPDKLVALLTIIYGHPGTLIGAFLVAFLVTLIPLGLQICFRIAAKNEKILHAIRTSMEALDEYRVEREKNPEKNSLDDPSQEVLDGIKFEVHTHLVGMIAQMPIGFGLGWLGATLMRENTSVFILFSFS